MCKTLGHVKHKAAHILTHNVDLILAHFFFYFWIHFIHVIAFPLTLAENNRNKYEGIFSEGVSVWGNSQGGIFDQAVFHEEFDQEKLSVG